MRNFKLQNVSVNYQVNEEKQVICAICKFKLEKWNKAYNSYDFVKQIKTIGLTSPKNGDKFDINIGKKVARAIAEKKAYQVMSFVIKKYLKILDREMDEIKSNLAKTEELIEHQKEYLKSF